MTEFNNEVMHRLVDEFKLEQGETGYAGADAKDFYVHKQSGKPLLTKRGVTKIKEARGFRHETPSISDIGGRLVISGWWFYDKDERKVWVTGEANPTDVAKSGRPTVEGSHPAAMAEKRFKVRGIIALECGEGSGVYGEDEFNDSFFRKDDDKPKKGAPPPPKAPEVPDWAKRLPDDWANECAAITEITGLERSAFEPQLFTHCTKFWSDNATQFVTPKATDMVGLSTEGKNPGRWGITAIKAAKEVVAALKDRNPVQLVVVNGVDGQAVEGAVLNPTASPGASSASSGSALDDQATPY